MGEKGQVQRDIATSSGASLLLALTARPASLLGQTLHLPLPSAGDWRSPVPFGCP
jgi:hypothetical protein